MDYSIYKVSFIVPVYNVEKYLRKCVESIVAQSHKNLEIIFVNDGSPDECGKILDDYAVHDNRIIVIHKENGGVSTARNAGLDVATGDYVCFADADDYVMPDYVEYLLKMAVDYDADISLTTDMFTTFHPNQVDGDEIVVKTAEQGTIDILTYKMAIGVYCKIFRRSFLGETIRFLPHIYIGEGFNFNTMALQRANKVVEGKRRVYFYRRDNPTSATTKFRLDKWQNAIYAIENIQRDLIIHTTGIEKAWQYAYWHTHCDAFNFLVMSKEHKKYYTEYNKWKNIVRKQSCSAFMVSVPLKDRLRALIMLIYPEMMAKLISKRNSRYSDLNT